MEVLGMRQGLFNRNGGDRDAKSVNPSCRKAAEAVRARGGCSTSLPAAFSLKFFDSVIIRAASSDSPVDHCHDIAGSALARHGLERLF
jgi:hypothetical protein